MKTFDEQIFSEKNCRNRQRKLNLFYLNKTLVAGLGNIYVDEVLLASKDSSRKSGKSTDRKFYSSFT